MGKAASEFGIGTSAVSQQIARLESELSTRLLKRSVGGVIATDAGVAFYQQAQLAIRHADAAALAAQRARLSGHVSIGFGSSIAAILGVPLILAMQTRYPDVRLRLVEALSGNLSTMLNSRQIDLCVIVASEFSHRWSTTALLDEPLFIMAAHGLPGMPAGKRASLRELGTLPLIMPSASHTLRTFVNAGFARARRTPNIVLEIDGFALLMEAVRAGVGATIQPGAATARMNPAEFVRVEIDDVSLYRRMLLACLSENEMSPAALAARIVVAEVVEELVLQGSWPGATPIQSGRPAPGRATAIPQ